MSQYITKRPVYRTPYLTRYYRLSGGQLYRLNTKTERHQTQLENDFRINESPTLFFDQYGCQKQQMRIYQVM